MPKKPQSRRRQSSNKPGAVAQLVAIARPDRRLVGIEIVAGARHGELQHESACQDSAARPPLPQHDRLFMRNSSSPEAWENRQFAKPGAPPTVRRIAAESPDVRLFGSAERHQTKDPSPRVNSTVPLPLSQHCRRA